VKLKLKDPIKDLIHFIGIIFVVTTLILLLERRFPSQKISHIISLSYLLMVWFIIVAIWPLIQLMKPWIFSGWHWGVCFIQLGPQFTLLKSPIPGQRSLGFMKFFKFSSYWAAFPISG